MNITAESLMQRYSMDPHVENGAFVEKHFEHKGDGRASSGSIYYYVAPGEVTKFHSIDCDEYWCYIKGSPLEISMIDEDNNLTKTMLGIEEGCEPVVYVRKGMIFGSKHPKKCSEGTFLSCITVPRFDPEGFKLYEDDDPAISMAVKCEKEM